MSTPIAQLNESIRNLGTAVGNMNTSNAEQNNNLRPGFTAIATSLEGLKTRVMNLIASVRRLGQYIEDLKAQQGTNISDIGTNVEDANELKRQIAQLRQDYNTLREELLNSQQQNATLQNNLNTTSQNLQQCNIDKAQLEKQITAMQSEINRLNNLPKPDPQEIQQLKAEIQQRQQELDNLKNVVIPGLQKQIADLKASIAPLQKEIADLKASIAPLQQQITKCNNDLETANRNITALRAQNQDLTEQITASTAAINKIIATINTSRFQLDPNLTQGITTQRDELAAQIGQLEAIVNSLLPGAGSSSSSGKGFSSASSSKETRALPSGWQSAVDSITGTTYYFNKTTGGPSQWNFPTDYSSSPSSPSSPSSSSSSSSLSGEPGENPSYSTVVKRAYRRPNSGSSSSNLGTTFSSPISNAYGQSVNMSSNLPKQPSLISSSNVISSIPDSNPITINGINTTLGELKTLLTNKSRNQSNPLNNNFYKANRALVSLNSISDVPQIFTANKINVTRDSSGKITLSPMSGGGRKSKKTKNTRKQKGGFEYSGKSKRRRFSVTRSPRSSQSRSSQRSSYETQSSVPPKYRARGTKKSKM